MWDGYHEVPVTSRAAEAELERQRIRRLLATGEKSGTGNEKPASGKGEGRKSAVQPKPEDQRGQPDPKERG